MKGDDALIGPEVRRVLRHYRRIAGVEPWHLALPLGLALLASLLEGASYWVLVPLSDAVAAGDFTTVADSRWFGWVPALLDALRAGAAENGPLVAIALLALLFGLRFLMLGVQYLRGHFVSSRDERYVRLVREETFARVLGFGRQYFDGQALGQVDSEISWSTSAVRLLSAVEKLVLDGLRLAVKGVVVVVISPILFLALVASLFVVHRLQERVSRLARALSAKAAAVEKRVRREALDLLGSIPLVKAHTREAEARSAYRETLRETEDVEVRRSRLKHLDHPIEEGVVLAGALLAEALILAFAPGTPAGHLARFCAFFIVAQQCLPDVKGIAESRRRVAEQIPRLEALARLFDDEDKHIVRSGPRTFRGLRDAIEVRGLDFHFQPGQPVLRGVDARFDAGEVTAVVGRSGAGKTTLADLIARLYECPPGTIFLDDVDVREFDLESLHGKLAMVSQEVWLLNRTLRANLAFGLPEPPPDRDLWAALDDVGLLGFFRARPDGLETELGDRGVRLSGGQRQRVALARTLLREPEILILDEATSELDSVVEARVLDAIERRLRGRTLVVIAHRLSTVRDADRILVMEEGRVVESGGWEELVVRGGAFASLYEAQFARAGGGLKGRGARAAAGDPAHPAIDPPAPVRHLVRRAPDAVG